MPQIKLTTPDLIVLGLLSERPMHGYDINQELIRRDVKDWARVSRPQVYYSLNKLKSLQMIAINFGAAAKVVGPERQTYKISKQGTTNLMLALGDKHWAINRTISPFLTWMSLSTHTSNKTINHVINERKTFLQKEINREKETLKSFKKETGEMLVPAKLIVELTIKQFKTELSWLQEVKKELLK